MTVTEYLHYIAKDNPVSNAIINGTYALFNKGGKSGGVQSAESIVLANVAEKIGDTSVKTINTNVPLWKLIGSNHNFIRLAGISGASAVLVGAVGGHNFSDKSEMKGIFETANRFHFFHSIAMLGMPFAKYPVMSGGLMTIGMLVFCGTLYYRAFTGEKPPFKCMAPIGGFCLISAWLSLLF